MLGCRENLEAEVVMMQEDTRDKTGERLAFGIMALFFCGFGWLNLLQGGISLKSKQGHVGFVDGVMGLVVAGGTLLLAAVCFFMLAHSLSLSRSNKRLGVALILLPPLFYHYYNG